MKFLLFVNLFGVLIFPFILKPILLKAGDSGYLFKPWHQLFHVIELAILAVFIGFNWLLIPYALTVIANICDIRFGIFHHRIRMVDFTDFRCSVVFIYEKLGWIKTDDEDEAIRELERGYAEACEFIDFRRQYGTRIFCDLLAAIIIARYLIL